MEKTFHSSIIIPNSIYSTPDYFDHTFYQAVSRIKVANATGYHGGYGGSGDGSSGGGYSGGGSSGGGYGGGGGGRW